MVIGLTWHKPGRLMERSVTSVYDRLKQLGIELPAVPAPVAAFVPDVRSGQLIFVSGHIAKRDGKPLIGKLGKELQTADGKQAARGIAIDLIGTLHAATTGNLDAISRILKLMVLVNSTPDFTGQHLVANGASELLAEVFADAGAHARSAFGVAQVPFGSCVEIDLIAEVT
jgi:enamine deaminase RidA (YjgF/YER057c/UK114 family)